MSVFEARLVHGVLLKKILECVKDLVAEGNILCSNEGMSLQAMDASHVSLVSLLLRRDGFETYRCDRDTSLGINFGSLSKVLKCAENTDIITIRSVDGGDLATFLFESPAGDKVSDFSFKLMRIDGEHLGIPETDYRAIVTMPSGEFQRICRDLTTISDSGTLPCARGPRATYVHAPPPSPAPAVTISVSKEGIQFSAEGDLGKGTTTIRPHASLDEVCPLLLPSPVTHYPMSFPTPPRSQTSR